MSWKRSRLVWLVAPVGLAAVLVAGKWFSAIAASGRALHPTPDAVGSSVGVEAPLFASAVELAREAVRNAMAEQGIPGVAVAVGSGGELVWSEGFGWANVASATPVTADSSFRIGTASALLTSAAAGVLVEEGRLALDDEIQTYVPDLPRNQWPVTLRHLLTDASGLGNESGEGGPLSRQRCESPAEAVKTFADAPLESELGSERKRSNYGWILVSAAMESAAERPFLDVMRDRLFTPLGMTGTGAESPEEENPEAIGEPAEDPPPFRLIREVILEPLGVVSRRIESADPATLYAPGFGYNPLFEYGLHTQPTRNLSCFAGAMAFYSTAPDLARFGLAAQDEALGVDGELHGRRVATLLTFPETGIAVAVLANLTDADTRGIADQVAVAFGAPTGFLAHR